MGKMLKNLSYRKLISHFILLCFISCQALSSPMHVYSFPTSGIFQSLNALAIDQNSGTIYASDTSGNKVYSLTDTGINPILLCNALSPLGIHVARKPDGAPNIWIMAFKDPSPAIYRLGIQDLLGGTISFPYPAITYSSPNNIVASLDDGNTKKIFITTPAPALNFNGEIKVFDAENEVPGVSIPLNSNEYATGLSFNGNRVYAAITKTTTGQGSIRIINEGDFLDYIDIPHLNGQLERPYGVSVIESNDTFAPLFIIDSTMQNIQYYEYDNELIPPRYDRKSSSDPNSLNAPVSLALNEFLGKIYVLDNGNGGMLHVYLSKQAWTKNGTSNVQQVKIDQPFPLTLGKKLMSSQIPGTVAPFTLSTGFITLAAGSNLQLQGGEFAPYKLIFDSGLISASTNSIVDTTQPVEVTENHGTIDVDEDIILQILTPIVKTGTYLGKLFKQGLGELRLTKPYNGSIDVESGVVSVSEGNDIGEINTNLDEITLGTNASSATLKFLPSQGNIGIFHEIVLNAGGGVFDVDQASGAAPTKISGDGFLTKVGLGTLYVSSLLTYTGGTNLIEGKIYTGADNVLPIGGDVFIGTDGTLDLSIYNQTIKRLTGSGLITSDSGDHNSVATLTLMPDVNSIFSGNIQDGTGQVAITLNSPGIEQKFTGINNFSGGLNLVAGTIAIAPTTLNPVLGTGLITMEDGTTLRWDINVTLPNHFVLNAGNPNNQGMTMDTGAHTGIIEQALEILGKLIKRGVGELKILVGGTNSGILDVLEGTFTNEGGGLTNNAGATISNDATFNNTGDIYNLGDFLNNVGAILNSDQGSFSNSGTLTNDGTIISGTFGNEVGANLYNNGTITYLANNIINNYGNFNNNGTVNNNGDFWNNADSNFNNNGTLNNNFFDNDAVFINEQNAILNNNYRFVNTYDFTNRINATVNNIGDFFNATNANFYNNGLFVNTGTLSGDGNLIFDGGEFQDLNSQILDWRISFGGNGNGGTLTSGPDNILILTQPITGDESLTLQGPGRIHLQGDSINTYSGQARVREGSLIVEGSIGDVVVEAGGRLTGLWDVINNKGFVGNVINEGIVTPSDPAGEFRIKGDYSSLGSGIIQVDVSPLASSKLHVEGTAHLDGSRLAVNVVSGEVADYKGKYFEVLSSDEQIVGQFGTIQSSQVRYKFKADYTNPKSVFLLFDGHLSFEEIVCSVSDNPNYISTGRALDNIIEPITDPDLKYVMSIANSCPEAYGITKFAAEITPDETIALPSIPGENAVRSNEMNGLRMNYRRDMETSSSNIINFTTIKSQKSTSFLNSLKHAFGQLNTNGYEALGPTMSMNIQQQIQDSAIMMGPKGGIWLQGFGNHTKQRSTARDLGYKNNSRGSLIGLDYKLKPNLYVGASIGYALSNVKWDESVTTGRVKDYLTSIYGTFFYNTFYINASLTGAYNRYNVRRRINFVTIDRTAHGLHTGYTFVPSLEFGKSIKLINGIEVAPFIREDYIHVYEKGYQEKNAGALNLRIKSKTTESLRSETGLNVSQKYTIGEDLLQIRAKVAYVNKYPLKNGKITANLVGQPGSFLASGSNKTQHQISPGLGIEYRSNSNMFISAAYDAQFDSKYKAHEISFRIGYKF